MMTIPSSFRWWAKGLKIDSYEKLKAYELVIRKAIGESIPTRFLELVGGELVKAEKTPEKDVENLKDFFVNSMGPGEYIVKLDCETRKSRTLADFIKKIVFYNRLQKENGKKFRIYIGQKITELPYDFAFVRKQAPTKSEIFQGLDHWKIS